MGEDQKRVAKYLREFEYELTNGRRCHVTVIRRLKNYYTGDVLQYVRIDHNDGDIVLDVIDDDTYEFMMQNIVKN